MSPTVAAVPVIMETPRVSRRFHRPRGPRRLAEWSFHQCLLGPETADEPASGRCLETTGDSKLIAWSVPVVLESYAVCVIAQPGKLFGGSALLRVHSTKPFPALPHLVDTIFYSAVPVGATSCCANVLFRSS